MPLLASTRPRDDKHDTTFGRLDDTLARTTDGHDAKVLQHLSTRGVVFEWRVDAVALAFAVWDFGAAFRGNAKLTSSWGTGNISVVISVICGQVVAASR